MAGVGAGGIRHRELTLFILSPWPINRKVTNVKCCFCQKAFNASSLLWGNPCRHPAAVPAPSAAQARQRCHDATILLFKRGKIHIYALRFEACLTLIDINDDDDAESGCCHAHSSTLPSSSSSADKSKTSNTSLCISQKGFGCTPKGSRLVNPVNSSLRRLQLLPLTAASFVNLAMEPPSP